MQTALTDATKIQVGRHHPLSDATSKERGQNTFMWGIKVKSLSIPVIQWRTKSPSEVSVNRDTATARARTQRQGDGH